jgi:MFS family permease
VGVLVDRWGAVRVFILSLWLNVGAYALSFFLVTGPVSFFVSSMATGLLFWMVMLTQMVFLQTLVDPNRFAQISSANSLVQSVLIAGAISPAVGKLLDLLKNYHRIWRLPAIGPVDVGPYRFVFLVLAALFAVALVCARQTRRHWLMRGGPDAYEPPR